MNRVCLGSFRCAEPLGSGGMATVWRGVYEGPGADRLDLAYRSKVALKVLTSARARDKAWLAAFAAEVRAVARLNHPHILSVYDFGEVSAEAERRSQGHFVAGSPWLAMELAEPESLGGRVVHMDWGQLRASLMQLLSALAHAHGQGLVHRDIKPANILFAPDSGALKLADFGLVLDVSEVSVPLQAAHAMGTPGYMAPEQFEGRVSEFGPWTDLYAVGCMVYRLVCGVLPYPAFDFAALREAHQSWPLPLLRPKMGVPLHLQGWLHGLMAKNPYERFPNAVTASAALQALGEATGTGYSEAVPPSETTQSCPDLPGTVASTALGESSRMVWSAPPLPDDWRVAESSGEGPLRGVGMRLFGVRTVPFVGRETQRDALWQLLRVVAAEGRARAVVLEGPAGVGKSRLAQFLRSRAYELAGVLSYVASYTPDGGVDQDFGEQLVQILGIQGCSVQGGQDRLRRRWPDAFTVDEAAALAQRLLGGGARSPSERRAMWWAAMRGIARGRTLIVLMEDVLWDLDSVEFARYSLEQLPVPVLFVLTARSEDLPVLPEVRQALHALAEHPQGDLIPVTPLPNEEALRLVNEGLGLRGDLAAQVQQRTAGNPLFAVQLVKDWVGRGLLLPDAEGFHLPPAAEVPLPLDLQGIWSHRMEAVLATRPVEEGIAVELAAVLGGWVDQEEWMRCCDAHGVSPGNVLEAFMERGLALQAATASTWSFIHGMARETVIGRARTAERLQELHATCAKVLGALGVTGSRLGRHLLESGCPEEALVPIRQGVEGSLSTGALAQAQVAVLMQQRALAAVDSPHVEGMWAALLRTRLARLQGRIHSAEESVAIARDYAEQLDHTSGMAQAWCETALAAYRSGRLAEVIETSRRGETLALSCGETRLVARCREVRARAFTDWARFADAAETYQDSREAYASEGDEEGVASCELGLGWVDLSEGRLERARIRIAQALSVLTALGARAPAAAAQNLLGEVMRALGELEQAALHYQESFTLHRECGSDTGSVIAQLNLAIVWVEGERYALAGRKVDELLGSMMIQGFEQFVGAAKLIRLVCDCSEQRWSGWAGRFEETTGLLGRTGQVHADLIFLAERGARLAAAQDREEESSCMQAFADQQRESMLGRS